MNMALDMLQDQIVEGRRRYAAGVASVLDAMLELNPQQDLDSLADKLRREAGVEVVLAQDVQVDWQLLTLEEARAWRCAVVRRKGEREVWLAMADPWDDMLLQRVVRRLGRAMEPAAAAGDALQQWFDQQTQPVNSTARVREGVEVKTAAHEMAGTDSPVVAFADAAIQAAYDLGASDVHFECDRVGVTVKHRLDGVMVRYAEMAGVQQAQEVVSRIKVLAQLDITERRVPQDGRFRFPFPHHPDGGIDLRVSIMPSVFGEDAVLRLLDKAQLRQQEAAVSLSSLGFDEAAARLIKDLSNEPSGMVLVTGPTGSGKTTTVYAALSEINTGLEKIITIEDPVEYELPGVLQIPVNERKGLTFAKGLRSILRHDPDRILVGEIRDAETAEIAVQSALTGHLVFTTVHANGIADIMGRFRHFGLDMFGFMSSLNGVVVQRLMRRTCPHCVAERELSELEVGWFLRHGAEPPRRVPQPVGCDACKHTGFKGRFVVAEVHVIDDELRDHVTEGAPVSILKRYAQSRGVVSLAQQSAKRVESFETTLEEVKRVVGWL